MTFKIVIGSKTPYDTFMTYRMIVTLLLCLTLTACSGAPPLPAAPDEEPLALPERFLGTWVYSPYNNIMVIHPDGYIEDYYTKDKDIYLFPDGIYDSVDLDGIAVKDTSYASHYRVIYIESPYSAYLLYRNNYKEPSLRNYQYIHIIIQSEYYMYKDRPEYLDKPPSIGWTFGCDTIEEDWTTPRAVLRERLLGSDPEDCTIDKLEKRGWPHWTYNRVINFEVNNDQ